MSSKENIEEPNEEHEEYEKHKEDNDELQSKIELQLGDIINISNPKNERLHNQQFFINYIDSKKMYLLNPETGEIIKLKISPDGEIGDGNIEELVILSRSPSPSYAVQNGLITDKWIDIHFGGDYPAILTGEITNLENDMIEIRTIDGDTIYINFDYKGIPEDLPIDFIEIRERPQQFLEQEREFEFLEQREEEQREQEQEKEKQEFLEELDKEHLVAPVESIQYGVQTKNVKNQIREFILQADQIRFGHEELGSIRQFVEVGKERQRYSIEDQVADLLDDLLSTIPNSQRTQKVLNNIHIMIERFKQLRDEFSFKDKNGVVSEALVYTYDYKPLEQYFLNFKKNLYWILPVVKNVKKVYNVNKDTVNEENMDVNVLHIEADIRNIMEIIKTYKSNSAERTQNKYAKLYNDLNPYFTPFDLVDEESSNLLIEKYVKQNIHTIVDNLENMNSSVFMDNNVETKRFVIQKYTDSLTKLDTLDVEKPIGNCSNKTKNVSVSMTPDDLMSIKSFITLPEPIVRFSRINLPGTNLLDKVNLNRIFFNYWQFFKKNTHIRNVIVENLDQEIEFDENNFVNNVKNYVLRLPEEEKKGMTANEIYKAFVKTIIPRTRVLFNLMKKYIQGKLSIIDVVAYLEPFLIYTDNLTYMQYRDILGFINQKISEYNINNEKRFRLFATLKKYKSKPFLYDKAYSVLSIIQNKDDLREDITHAYDITDDKIFTNSEILRKLTIKDYSRFYSNTLSLQSVPLMFPSEFASLFDLEQSKMNKQIESEERKEDCKTMIVAKQYFSLTQLEEDNNKVIYFDKKFDKTNYSLLDEYEKNMMQMTPEDFISHLISDLKKKKNLNDEDAEYLAETLIDGHKKVIPGQYAILYYPSAEFKVDYFVRNNNQWVLDNSLEKNTNTTDPDMLCELQKKCIAVPTSEPDMDSKCESITLDKITLQNQVLKDVISEFDTKYRLSKDEFERKIREEFDYSSSIIPMISKINSCEMLKYNNQKYKLGINVEEDITNNCDLTRYESQKYGESETRSFMPISPYAKLLNMILGERDFVKQQNDIIRFVNKYTRPPIMDGFGPLNKRESEDWLYCIKTNIELIPVFKFDMAHAFITNPSGYNDFVDILISKIGKESDDGDSWVAKGSGWTIRKADFDIEEGYDEGFRVSSRAVMEESAGTAIIAAINKEARFKTPESKMISNIINTLSVAMSLTIEPYKDFIVNCVSEALQDNLDTEEDYKQNVKQMADKGKKIQSYKDYFNSKLMYYTLAMFLIAVQTAIPSVKTRKTHPGCVRSFEGYPFDNANDFSTITYLTCVAYDIRQSVEPWNVLKKKDTIEKEIKFAIDNIFLGLPEVQHKFIEKTDYLLLSHTDKIPEEHDIANWINFLPPLFPFKISKLSNVSAEFKTELLSDLRNGSPRQREKILVLDSKIIKFSLALQEKIQNIVQQKQAILKNSAGEPYLENACCSSKDRETTIDYFINNDRNISDYNIIVTKLVNILEDITSYTKSSIFCSEINTKNKYPPINQQFDEKTIYLAFIYFCKFRSLIPIPENVLPLCSDKPEYNMLNYNDNIDEMIRKLKDNGRNYNNETFLRLLQLIGRNNIIHIDLDVPLISSFATLNNVLETIQDSHDEVIEGSLITKLQNVLNTYDIASTETNTDVRELNNLLTINIRSMKVDIEEFMVENRGSKVTNREINHAKSIIQSLSLWYIEKDEREVGSNISSDSMYTIVNFYKTFISYFIDVFPNIILNKVDFSETFIPRYMNLSSNHALKISDSIKNYYSDLKMFYGNPKLISILNTIQKTAKNIELLSQYTPCFTTNHYGEQIIKPVFDERTSKMLYEYYFLRVLIQYIDLADDMDMIVHETQTNDNVEEFFTTEILGDQMERDRDLENEFYETTKRENIELTSGDKKELKQLTCQLIIAFLNMANKQKDKVDISYEQIRDNIFKLKEREKMNITERLKIFTDEERELDTVMKINKLGVWSKGLQKGLTMYDKEMYEEEAEFRDEMEKAERNIRKKNHNATDENINQYVEDYMEDQEREEDIERDAYDMNYLNDDYEDGNFDGIEAPEEEYDDYRDYD